MADMTTSLNLPATNTFEENVHLWAEHYNTVIKPGHGIFFNFKGASEYKKPVLDYLSYCYGWTL